MEAGNDSPENGNQKTDILVANGSLPPFTMITKFLFFHLSTLFLPSVPQFYAGIPY